MALVSACATVIDRRDRPVIVFCANMDFPFSFPLIGRCRGVTQLERSYPGSFLKLDAATLDLTGARATGASAVRPAAVKLRELYVARLDGAFVTDQGTHVTRDSLLIEELSRHLEDPIAGHRRLRSFRLRSIRRLQQTVVSLVAPCQYNYYHWMLEALPKLGLLRAYGAIPEDAIYYAPAHKPFQAQSLEHLGVTPLLPAREAQVIRAATVLAASIPGPSGTPHAWAVEWLREQFSTLMEQAEGKPPVRCLIVNRRGSGRRQIVNEAELVRALAALAPQVVALERLTLAEQADLFARAQVVIAPHGAGLTNLLFAGRGCRVFELFEKNYHVRCYERLAGLVGCGYTALDGEDERDPVTGNKNLRIDVEALARQVLGRAPLKAPSFPA
jgi:capsular polysaccharide biosynthesis protein